VVVGNPIRLRFPPTPSGKRVVFFDLEDETGLLNVTCFDAAYQRDGHNLVCNPYLTVRGVAQWRDGHTAFLVRRMYPYDPVIRRLVEADDLACLATADFLSK
jgi:DNA polymerase III alpha subunit